MKTQQPFHLAFPVHELGEAKTFYTKIIGCSLGRSSKKWIEFNMFGHQVVAHLSPEEAQRSNVTNVDGKNVPVRHFGIVLEWDQWHIFADELWGKGVKFLIEPTIRFKEKAGE